MNINRKNFNIDAQNALKRSLDLLVAITALILLWPLMAVIAIGVMIESPGGAIYRQKRIGKGGKPFNLYKFRSMAKNSSDANYMKYLSDLIASERNGSKKRLAYRKMDDDRRVTKVGKIIRRFYLDELPQCINIIKGEMSLVGPRPHVQLEVDNYLPGQKRRLAVKPGVTGLWQVEGKMECTFNQLINMDLYYIDHWSFWFDVQILIKTFIVLLRGGEVVWGRIGQPVPKESFQRLPIPVTGDPGSSAAQPAPLGGNLLEIDE